MQEQEGIRPRGIGEVLIAAWEIYRRYWARLLAIVAMVTVPLVFLQYFLADVIRKETPTETAVETAGIEAFSTTFWRATAAAFTVGIITFFMTQIVTGAMARASAGAFLGRTPTVGAAYRFGVGRLWSVLLVGLLFALAVTGGFILLVIPGFIVMTRLIVAIPVVVVEGARGRAALRRSWTLTRGYAWRTFGALLLMGLLTGLATSVLTLPFDRTWLGQAIAAAVGTVVAMPYAALVIALLYFDLRARHEEVAFDQIRRQFDSVDVHA